MTEYAARLAPHEWDRLGNPPPLGPDYETGYLAEAVAFAAILLDAEEYAEEADRLREEADVAEDRSAQAEREADKRREALAKAHPLLAVAIEDHPHRFKNEEAVRHWIEDVAGVGA